MVIGLSGVQLSLIIRVINKMSGVRFVNHEYDYGPELDDTTS